MRFWTPAVLLIVASKALAASTEPGLEASSSGPSIVEDASVAPERVAAASPSIGLEPQAQLSEIGSTGSACSAQHGAAAYVCCDGDGGFTVCRGRAGGDRLLLGCIERHEEDHLAWFAEHLPDACVARPRGACRFEMTPHQFRDLECSGYSREFRCLSESRALTTGRRRRLADVLWRQRQLVSEAESRFACVTGDW